MQTDRQTDRRTDRQTDKQNAYTNVKIITVIESNKSETL